MQTEETTREIERIRNLITNYLWTISKQEITEDEIILTIKQPKMSSLSETSPGPS